MKALKMLSKKEMGVLLKLKISKRKIFSNKLKQIILNLKTSEELFSFNSPFGACDKCEGFGSVMAWMKTK